jgi:hypothetical protein
MQFVDLFFFIFCYSLQVTFEGEKTVEEMYKFIKKHAGIPFKWELITTEESSEDAGQTKDEIEVEILSLS